MLDEPTASLNPDTGDMIRGWLEAYRAESGCTILLASHNMAEVERLCGQVLVMKQGRIVDRGMPAGLRERYQRDDLEDVFLDIARNRTAGGDPAAGADKPLRERSAAVGARRSDAGTAGCPGNTQAVA